MYAAALGWHNLCVAFLLHTAFNIVCKSEASRLDWTGNAEIKGEGFFFSSLSLSDRFPERAREVIFSPGRGRDANMFGLPYATTRNLWTPIGSTAPGA